MAKDMYQKRKERQNKPEEVNNKTNINWYPGHMAKAKRLIKEKLPLIDIVYVVVDSRMPYSSYIKDLDSLINNKPRILIMSKLDLCDLSLTKKWSNYYQNKGFKVIEVDLEKNKNVNKIVPITIEVMKEMNEKRESKGLKQRKIRALIVGIPNVGKSTLINRLVGKKVVNVGNKPGVTKSLDWIRISNEVELLDTPGILWPKLDSEEIAYNLASLTAIKEEILPIDDVAIYILKMLSKYYPNKLKERYDLDSIDFEDIIPSLDSIGKKRGCLVKGGEVDYDKVCSLIVNDLKDGRITNITFDRIDENE